MELATLRSHRDLNDRGLQDRDLDRQGMDHQGLDHQALQAIFEMLPIGVLVTDADGKSLFHNRAALQILEAADSASASLTDVSTIFGWYLPDRATLLSNEELPVLRALRGEDICEELYFVGNANHSQGVWIRVTGRAIRDSEDFITSALLLFHDVTEDRLFQQTTTLLSQVVEQIKDGVLVTDRQGFIEYVNPAFESMTGFSAQDVRGKTPRILNSGLQAPAFFKGLWSELLAGRSVQATVANRKKSGEIYQVEETITPIIDDSGDASHFVAVIKDITEALNVQEREVQLRLARRIQKRFYRAAPTLSGFDVAAAAYPAYHTSGDYFDFIPLPNNRLGIAVGDVEGHGFGSALVMALTRAYVHSFASMGMEVDQILSQVNRMLVNDLGDGCFVTLMLASLDLNSRSLVYAGAGHIPGYVLDPSGSTTHTLESNGPPVGLFPDMKFSPNPAITLEPGQLLVLFTDGITESASPDGKKWGAQGALDYLATHRARPAHQLAEGLYQEALRFSCHAAQKDDIASVIVKVGSAVPTVFA